MMVVTCHDYGAKMDCPELMLHHDSALMTKMAETGMQPFLDDLEEGG
jgi:hypothetical protein